MTLIAGIDLETTGISVDRGHKICEIAMSLYRYEMGNFFKSVLGG